MKNIFFLSFVLLLFTGCSKFLEERSQSEMTPIYTKDYSEVLFGDGYPISQRLQPQIRYMDDDVQCYNLQFALGTYANVARGSRAAYSWQPDFMEVSKDELSEDLKFYNSWETYYKLILGTNVALQYADISIGTINEKWQLKGEAFALRAYYYFMLVNLYGLPYNDKMTDPATNPGVPLKLDANVQETFPTRNSVKEVYTSMIRDTDSAIHYLEKDKVQQSIYRVNFIVAHQIAARIYQQMENWDKVIEHSNLVIAERPTLRNLNTTTTNDLVFLSLQNPETYWTFGNSQEQRPSAINGTHTVSANLIETFEANDLRNIRYFEPVPPAILVFVNVPYYNFKLANPDNPSAYKGIAWRTPEVYLNRAEAYLQRYKQTSVLADAQKGLDDLNHLRANRLSNPTPWTVGTPDEMLQLCREERRRELFMEEAFRWFDLRRYGMPSISHHYVQDAQLTTTYTLRERDPQYTLPIPRAALDLNPGLIQNPQLPSLRVD